MTKDLPDVPGKEGLIEIVLLAPGEVTPAHRHNADVFVYVLEGSIITRLEGRESQTFHAGEAFYESPTDVHIASRNASTTQPVRLLVFYVKKKGAPQLWLWGKAMPLTKGAMARPLRTFEKKLRNKHLCWEFVDEQSQDGIEPKQSSDDEPTMGGIG